METASFLYGAFSSLSLDVSSVDCAFMPHVSIHSIHLEMCCHSNGLYILLTPPKQIDGYTQLLWSTYYVVIMMLSHMFAFQSISFDRVDTIGDHIKCPGFSLHLKHPITYIHCSKIPISIMNLFDVMVVETHSYYV
eukprot:883246_1